MSTEPEEYNRRLQEKALHIANYLNALTPYERALVLFEAEAIWEQHDQPDESKDDTTTPLIACQWLSGVYHRLSPDGRQVLIELAQEMDDTERFERLIKGDKFESLESGNE